MVTDGIQTQAVTSAVSPTSASGGSSQDLLKSFNAAFEQAQQKQAAAFDASGLQSVLSPLLALGEKSAQLEAQVAPLSSSNEYRPSELMMITMRSHEFLFRCELTANVANRASDGVQQLFRQQG